MIDAQLLREICADDGKERSETERRQYDLVNQIQLRHSAFEKTRDDAASLEPSLWWRFLCTVPYEHPSGGAGYQIAPFLKEASAYY